MKNPVRVGAMLLVVLVCSVNHGQSPATPAADKPVAKAPLLPFEPGEFLTAEDGEYLLDCLERVGLTPEDLKFEKKMVEQRFLLDVCARCLDDPLCAPRITEIAAREFSIASPGAARAKHAATLLDLPHKRWTPESLHEDIKKIKDAENEFDDANKKLSRLAPARGEAPSAEYNAQQKVVNEIREQIHNRMYQAVFGGKPKVLFNAHEQDDASSLYYLRDLIISLLEPSIVTLRCGNSDIKTEALNLMAALMPGYIGHQGDLLVKGVDADSDADVLALAAQYDLASVLVAAGRASGWMEEFASVYQRRLINPQWAAGKPANIKGVTGNLIAAWEGPWGKFVIGGTGPNTYEGDDFIGVIDLGGDDVYRGRVACGLGLPGKSPIGFVIDLSGNDQYLGEDFTQGFGFMGIGVLWDLGKGNDIYRARFACQGCGLLGYGQLYDDGGDDLYVADSGAQGAGCFGYGHLLDRAGNDAYRGCRYTQGFAQVRGVGVLTDGAGNDHYYAGGKYLHAPLWNDRFQSLSQGFSIGNRRDGNPARGSGGGVALLLDEGDGNDVYNADIYGQGVSYWYSLGMLVDRGGHDVYSITQYGMGGGIHLSTGILVDLKGNDSYSNYYGVGHGGAHDYAVGWLIDRAGNDLYQGNGQGQGLNFSVAILLDCSGDDSRSTYNDGSIGKGHNNSVSLLLDLGGTDFYGPKEIKDGRFTRRGTHEMVYDVPEGWFPAIDTSTIPTKQDPPPRSTVVQHILISFDGCRVPLKGTKNRTEAEAAALAQKVLKLARTREADWAQLQKTYNEDSGKDGSNDHNEYTCTPDAGLIKEFKSLGLSLGVGQIALSEKGPYGWHIIKRVK